MEKPNLHPRNSHRSGYDFEKLIQVNTELSKFTFVNDFGTQTIDFSNPDAVKALNKSLLISNYNIKNWDIPKNYLCPPIPGRADYLHYIADLLTQSNFGTLPEGHQISVLDIGVGANCIYPIVGVTEYGWNFIGSEINPDSIEAANKIEEAND